jgi:hypothetical protein
MVCVDQTNNAAIGIVLLPPATPSTARLAYCHGFAEIAPDSPHPRPRTIRSPIRMRCLGDAARVPCARGQKVGVGEMSKIETSRRRGAAARKSLVTQIAKMPAKPSICAASEISQKNKCDFSHFRLEKPSFSGVHRPCPDPKDYDHNI